MRKANPETFGTSIECMSYRYLCYVCCPISNCLQPATPSETLVETLSILSILISRFPANLSSSTLNPQPISVLAPLLAHQRPVVRKRAILTLAQFIPTSQRELFSELLNSYVYPYLTTSASVEKQRTTLQLVAAVARHSASQIAPVLRVIIPGILAAVQRDDDELRESGLQVCCIVENMGLD
jgi:cullin-associated NEDD8-dissociated protein 1